MISTNKKSFPEWYKSKRNTNHTISEVKKKLQILLTTDSSQYELLFENYMAYLHGSWKKYMQHERSGNIKKKLESVCTS